MSPGSAFEKPRLLNYLTAPNVLVWSAALASCACPGLFPPAELVARGACGGAVPFAFRGVKWVDGSVAYDLPKPHMQRLFNVDYFIVAQTNPHIIPFAQSAQRRPALVWRRARSRAVDRALGGLCKGLRVLAGAAWSEAAFWVRAATRTAQALGLGPAADMAASVLHQTFVGDCTIVAPPSLALYARLLRNPDAAALRGFMDMGAACTWPWLPAIRRHSELQLAMDSAVQALSARAMEQALAGGVPAGGGAGQDGGAEGGGQTELRRRWKLEHRDTNLNLSLDSL